ncbi:MAG: MBL fold metallo-hydrolase [Parcubacteria group bacterium]|nr:MAG: MBL fold metallo-hydrolase [Parcubacteria group bacterium]
MNKYGYLIFVILLLLGLLVTTFRTGQKLHVGFLDVGQGDAIIVRTPSGQNILIDGGPDNSFLSQLADFLPWWERKIDYLVITHYHADHIIGLVELLNKYKVEHVLVTAHQPDKDFMYQLWQKALVQHKLESTIVRADQKFIFADNLSVRVLSAEDKQQDFNGNSLVLRLSYGQIDFLMTGDLPVEGEQNILAQGSLVSSEVLKVGHHGSKYSSGQAFLQAVNPELCVITSGKDNKFGHPHPEAVKRLENSGCKIVNTQNQGTIRVISDGQTISY